MNLGQLHTDIATTLRRGTSQNAAIPGLVAEAALFLEQNYSFRYMEKFGRVTINASAEAPERIEFDNTRVKAFKFLKVALASEADRSERYVDLVEVEANALIVREVGLPTGYYQDGYGTLVLDNVPTSDMELALCWTEYTDWPTDLSATPRLVLTGYNALKAQSLLYFGQDLRDPRMTEVYTIRRDEALSALLRAEEEYKQGGKKLRMGYGAPVTSQYAPR